MDYRDVEGGDFIYWCSACGPLAHQMEGAIQEAFQTRPDFAEEFRAAIDHAKAEAKEAAQ